jgi:hypothetical protein
VSGTPATIVRAVDLPPVRTALLCTTVVVLACLAGSVARPAAAAGKPACWQVLLNDWYDGRIDGTYPIHCYRDALKHLPSDVDTYSSARDDIERALQSARVAARKSGQKLGNNTLIQPSTTTTAAKPTTHGGKPGKPSKHPKPSNVITISTPRRKQPGGIQKVATDLNGGSASSFPLPLLILGGLALALVAAGAAGIGWRHYQGRKPRP